MNISTRSISVIGIPTEPMSTVLKPDVRVTLWNTEVVNFPNQEMPDKTPFHSKAANATDPKATRITEK